MTLQINFTLVEYHTLLLFVILEQRYKNMK